MIAHTSGLPRQSLPGGPHERGVLHAEAFADEIRHDVRTPPDTSDGGEIDTGRARGDFHTEASLVVALAERRTLLTDGPPRDAEYREHRLI